MMKVNLKNKRFGRLKAIRPAGKANDGHIKWLCICTCGKYTKVANHLLKAKQTKSCGCLRKEIGKRCSLKNGKAGFNIVYRKYTFRAKNRNIKFNLTKNQFRILIKKKCHYCKLPPQQYIRGTYKKQYLYNGIDRLNSKYGYSLTNCVACCGTCNRAKLTLSEKEYKQWLQGAVERLKT